LTPASPKPLVEDFDDRFDDEDLAPQRYQRGARVPGNAAGIGVIEVIETTCRVYLKNIVACLIGAVVLSAFAGLAVGVALAAVLGLSSSAINDPESKRIMTYGVNVLMFSLLVWLHVGFLAYMLHIARGEKAQISDLFGAGVVWVQAMMLSALQAGLIAGCAFGAVELSAPILYLPGVVAALLLEPAKLVLLDRDTGVIDAIASAARLAASNILPVGALFPLGVVGLALSCFVTFGVGAPVFVPFFTLLYEVTYLRVTEQRAGE
jgi:hypothetical protein